MTGSDARAIVVKHEVDTVETWTLSSGQSRLGQVTALQDSFGTTRLSWDLTREAQSYSEVREALLQIIHQVFSEPSTWRIVHFLEEHDYRGLAMARELGFVAEGVERVLNDSGEQSRLWRVVLLRTDAPNALKPVTGAEVIDGSRPAQLVAEFHDVYEVPNLVRNAAPANVDYPRIGLRMSLVKEEFAELCGAVYGPGAEQALLELFLRLPDDGERDVIETADALADLVYVIYGMALESGIDLDRVLAEVQRSNLSKLMPDGSVLRREDGKILKGPAFSEPDIAAALQKSL